MQQGQQNAHGLLLEPAQDHGQREIVHAAVKCIGQGHSHLDGRVGIITLAHVEQSGNAANVPEFQLVEAELATGQGQDDTIIRHGFSKFGVVVASGLGSVAPAHQEEVLDLTGLDRLNDLVSHTQDSVVGKTNGYRTFRHVRDEAFCCQGRVDHGREILVFNVLHTGERHQAGGEDAGLITLLGLNDAVGGHEDGTGEGFEFPALILPGASVIANEVVVFLEFGVGQTREHLTVRVHVHALALGLLQQGLKILEIMA